MLNRFKKVADKLHKLNDLLFVNYTDYYNWGEVCIEGRRIPKIVEDELNKKGFNIVYWYGTEFGNNVSVTAQFSNNLGKSN